MQLSNPFETILEKLEKLETKIEAGAASGPAIIEIIARDELCKRLAITEPTAIRWEKKGVIPAFRIGDLVRYNWHSVIEALEAKGKS